MAFHDVRLPDNVERGALGGPRFRTSIQVQTSGVEQRNSTWEDTRGEWDIGYGLNDRTELDTLIAFFYARQGSTHSFPFKDWSDFLLGDDASDTPQTIATGDGIQTAFQIIRRYVSGLITFPRDITKPVNGTVRVFLDSVEEFSGFTINHLTGEIVFDLPPSIEDVGAICEYNVPVRFMEDKLDISLDRFDLGDIPSIPVIEVKGE